MSTDVTQHTSQHQWVVRPGIFEPASPFLIPILEASPSDPRSTVDVVQVSVFFNPRFSDSARSVS